MFPMRTFEDYAAAAVERFEACCENIGIPSIHSCPENCCEFFQSIWA